MKKICYEKKELIEEKEKKRNGIPLERKPLYTCRGQQGEVGEFKLSFKIHLVKVLIIDIGYVLLRFKQN